MRDNWKQLLSLLLGAGMVLVDSDKYKRVSSKVRDRAADWRDTAGEHYDEVVNRANRAGDALRGKPNYAAPVGGFLLGVGVGVGLGLLFAPASGEETRENLREQANDWKERASQQAANIRSRASEKVSELKDQVRDEVGTEASQTAYPRRA